MPTTRFYGGKSQYSLEALATLTQEPPVQNTWYTVLDTTYNVAVYTMVVYQKNDETNAKNVNIRLTVDGTTLTKSADYSLADNSYCNPVIQLISSDTLDIISIYQSLTSGKTTGSAELFYARSFKAEVRTTSAPGTNQKLHAWIRYFTLQEAW